jgi:hypothetical protein
LNNNWSALPATAYPDQKFLAGVNHRFKLGNHSLGNVTALTYNLSNSSEKIQNTDYSIYDYSTDQPSYLNQFIDEHYSNSARLSVMNNTSLYLNKGTRIGLRNLFNQSGSSRYTMRTGREWYNNGRFIKSEELRYLSRSIYTGQLAGDHDFGEGRSKLDWLVGYATSNKKEPDTVGFK